ncbi:MAG: NAD(+) kinase [Candidatus Latescibacteria bacterium]|nr:NAD(+) kinase [Candidatus Latescibacterota bacterium]
MKIERLGIIPNMSKAGIEEIVSDSLKFIPEHIRVIGEEEVAGISGRIEPVDSFENADLILALGGDGTILHAARVVQQQEIPVMGLKIRSLGFLAEDNQSKALEELFSGGCLIQDRMRLEAAHGKGSRRSTDTALNDIVINGVGVSRVLHIRMSIGETLLGEYLSDGVIIATPTGSTAYSLAAGGPIIEPFNNNSIIITPLCPHSLSVRPLVISAEEKIELEVMEAGDGILMTKDGQAGERIELNDRITIGKSPKVTRLVVRKDYNFYTLVREKLRWGGVLRRR